ncbi:hypothetical protein J4456_04930 [Candidatus Pacearchaeota archaeon]|nr:hypothetical protein [Candidatus Pacearchaeota archaeon]
MKRKINQKGKIITDWVIIVIVLLISFIVILFLLVRIYWLPVIDKQTCHQSVIYRSSAKLGPLQASTKTIPLKCETEKICFSMSGDDCVDLSSTKKNPVKKIKLSKDITKAKETIKETIAESMRECHWMLGEGKLNFMPASGFKANYGLVCTRFVFDDEAKKTVQSITYPELFVTLEKKTLSDGRSYLEYLYPGWKESKQALQMFEAYAQNPQILKENPGIGNLNPADWKIVLDNERGYAILAQISPPGNWKSWALAGASAVSIPVGAAFLASGIGAPVGFTILGLSSAAGAITGGAVLWYSYPEKYDYAPPFIYEFDIDKLKNIGVYSFEIAPS